ncbi:MAG: UDP-N-acetylmuramoyl-tripeptide--D-alanyl-D-alanine ligase [Anaerolineae bacterium]|jgi:UDP-N-acetylmuramoyl-tripeptide--D-alanyl-D-alanine ligase
MTTETSVLTLVDLIAGLTDSEMAPPPEVVAHAGSTQIHTAVIDSRQATGGSLFVALRGEHRDGHDFIPDAIENGAAAVIAEKAPSGAAMVFSTESLQIYRLGNSFCLIVPDSLRGLQQAAAHWRRQPDMAHVTVIGVTGSVGKTSSKEVIAAVMSQRHHTLKSQASYNNEIGLPLTLLHLTSAHEQVILEMGMYDIGEIAELAEIALPRIGVVTNIGPTHLERLGSIERITQAKAELAQALPPADEGGVAILNADDKWVRAMADQTQARVFTYGLRPDADLWADHIQSEGLQGIRFRFHYGEERIHIRAPLLGRHSVHTALRAAAVGLVEGLSWEEIVSGLQDRSAQLRLVSVDGPAGSIILDDTYNASPASTAAALNLLSELEGRKIAVLGDMYELGRHEEEGHKIVGRRARDAVHVLVAVGSLGRIIGEEALRVGMEAQAVHILETNAQAIDLLQTVIEPGDRILVKGSRGMGMEEIVAALTQFPTLTQATQKENGP